MEEQKLVALDIFDPFEHFQVTGIVNNFDLLGHRVKLLRSNDIQWIKVNDILDLHIIDEEPG
ncbi:hypothetical protein J6TS7_53390 [Paenibacillus dendritiformis]|nr:hypothetical protein J6TS7_53390 [Paenibacillus dendritiformis]